MEIGRRPSLSFVVVDLFLIDRSQSSTMDRAYFLRDASWGSIVTRSRK